MDPTMQLFTKESTLVSMRVLQSSNTTACDNNYGDNYFSPPSLMEKNWLVMQCVWISCWLSEWMRKVLVCRCDGLMDWLLRMGNDLHLLIIAFKLWVIIQSWNSSITLRTHSISRWESIDDDGSSHQQSFVSIVHSRSFSCCSTSFSLLGGTISSARKIPVAARSLKLCYWVQ